MSTAGLLPAEGSGAGFLSAAGGRKRRSVPAAKAKVISGGHPEEAPIPRRHSAPAAELPPDREAKAGPVGLAEGDDSPWWMDNTLEVNEFQNLALGPFGPRIDCEILSAWYGPYPLWAGGTKGEVAEWEADSGLNITELVRQQWNPETGLRLSRFNHTFGDPAPLRPKRVVVKYRLANIRPWDVSRGTYPEGFDNITLPPRVLMKALLNVVGVTVAAAGYGLCKACNFIESDADSQGIAEFRAFQWSFNAWLRLNGITPSVSYEPTTKKPDTDMRQTPLIVSNHICYIDGFVLAGVFGAPRVMAMQGTSKTPVLGRFAEEIGVIEVDRADQASRVAAKEAIAAHVDKWTPGDRPLLLFPEGTTSNGDDILQFKKGAFLPGAPVRPVVLTYTGSWHPANVNFKKTSTGNVEPTGDVEWCQQFLGNFMHSLQVKVLPPYIPSQDERTDPDLYAANVHALMSREYEKLRRETKEVEASRKDSAGESWFADLQRLSSWARLPAITQS